MKKRILSIVVLLFSIIALVACGETIVGEAGPKGEKGDPGKSAYQLAVEKGFTGTEEEFLLSLEGARGEKGETGAAGSNGVAGKNAHEISIFEDDGAMYWKYLPNEGENAELEFFDAKFLYYTKDYITVEFYIGEELYKSLEIKRDEIANTKLPEIADNDELIGMGYTLDGWMYEDGDDYSLSNHSAKVYAKTHYQGVTINVNFGKGADGNQYYAYDINAYADFAIGKLLTAINEVRAGQGLEAIEASAFYTTYSQNTGDTDTTGPLDQLVAGLKEKGYTWLLNFVLSGEKFDNKRMKGLADKYELSFNHEGSSPVVDHYSYEFFANWIHNFLNKSGENLHSGSATYYPAKDFSAGSAYVGIDKADAATLAEFTAVPENAVTSLENVNNLNVNVPEGFAFFKVEGETKTEVEFEKLVEGETYLCEYKAN